MEVKQKKKKDYVNNQDFLIALEDYKARKLHAIENNLPAPSIPNYIGECWMKIAEGLSHRPNFINYSYRDEMIADGIENCLMYFENFDSTKTKNPFAYFTQVIWYAFIRRIQKEKKQQYVKYKATENFGILEELELMEHDDQLAQQFEVYENVSEFIETFEESKRQKKQSVNKPKGIELFLEM